MRTSDFGLPVLSSTVVQVPRGDMGSTAGEADGASAAASPMARITASETRTPETIAFFRVMCRASVGDRFRVSYHWDGARANLIQSASPGARGSGNPTVWA